MKKVIKTIVCMICVVSVISVALAASSTTFYVNNVKITGKVTINDTSPYNPLTYDSVTAKTTSAAAMDTIQAKAIITFFDGSTRKTYEKSKSNNNATSVSATVKAAHASSVGSSGKGEHYASHNGLSGSGNTNLLF